jgi:hypothetical protein
MKTTTTTLAIILLSLAIIFTACTRPKTRKITAVAGLLDVTDKNVPKPDIAGILKLYGFDEDKWNGGMFNFSALTRVSLNPKEYIHISQANEWLSNSYHRDKEIKAFKNNMSNIITNLEQSEAGQENSSIYQPMANELNKLSQGQAASRKILLVYSDLLENTAQLSYYNQKDLSRLIKEPEALTEQLEQIQAIDDLTGIEVYFIYQPQDSKSDAVFGLVSGFYKSLLESKNAKVTITAKL